MPLRETARIDEFQEEFQEATIIEIEEPTVLYDYCSGIYTKIKLKFYRGPFKTDFGAQLANKWPKI